MNIYCYLTFPTTYFALRSEAVLQETSFTFKLVPVPRSISSSCGTALRCFCAELTAIMNTLQQSGIEIKGSFELAENNGAARF